jgi:peptidyl-prolyl cis-trans isomerase SurA
MRREWAKAMGRPFALLAVALGIFRGPCCRAEEGPGRDFSGGGAVAALEMAVSAAGEIASAVEPAVAATPVGESQIPVEIAPAPVERAVSAADGTAVAADGTAVAPDGIATPEGHFWDPAYVNGVVAVVNGRIITAGELRQELAPFLARIEGECRTAEEFREKLRRLAREILEKLVDNVLIVEDFERSGRQLSAMQKDFQLDEFIRSRFGGDRLQFLDQLHGHGKSLQQFRREMEEGLIVAWMSSRVQQSRAEISPRQIQNYYDGHRDQFFQPPSVRLGQILLPTAGEGEDSAALFAKLAAGEDFEALEKNGGGSWLAMTDLLSELVPLVEAMAVGETVGPVPLGDLLVLLHLYERREGRQASLEEVQEEIEKLLLRDRLEEAQRRWLAGLREKAHVQIYL